MVRKKKKGEKRQNLGTDRIRKPRRTFLRALVSSNTRTHRPPGETSGRGEKTKGEVGKKEKNGPKEKQLKPHGLSFDNE